MYRELEQFMERHRNARYFHLPPESTMRRVVRGNVIMTVVLAVIVLTFLWHDGMPANTSALPFLLMVSALLVGGVVAAVWDALHYRHGWEYRRGAYSKLFSYSNAYEVYAVVRRHGKWWEYELLVEDLFTDPKDPSFIVIKHGMERTLSDALVEASLNAWRSLEGEWD